MPHVSGQPSLFVELCYEDFLRGMQLAVYYATEARRLAGASLAKPELFPVQKLDLAEKLRVWLRDEWTKPTVTARDIYTYGPNSIRNRRRAIELAEILQEHGWLHPVETRRSDRREWRVIRESSR
jgi:hypothetical protein